MKTDWPAPSGGPMFDRLLTGSALFLCLTLPCFAQAGQNPPSPDADTSVKPATPDTSAAASATSRKKKPKKVWTNDEIPKTSGVSVVGEPTPEDSSAEKPAASANTKNNFRRQQINQYKSQLSKMQAQIEAIDKRIDQLKNFKAENTSPSGEIDITHGYNLVPISDQIKQLEEKKKQLRAKMDDLET